MIGFLCTRNPHSVKAREAEALHSAAVNVSKLASNLHQNRPKNKDEVERTHKEMREREEGRSKGLGQLSGLLVVVAVPSWEAWQAFGYFRVYRAGYGSL